MKMLYRLSIFINKNPLLTLVIGFVSTFILSITPIARFYFPDFGDPKLGFEARGTEIAGRLKSWYLLMESTRPSGILTNNPAENIPPEELMKAVKIELRRTRSVDYNEEPSNKIESILPFEDEEIITSEIPTTDDNKESSFMSLGKPHPDVDWVAIMNLGRNITERTNRKKNKKPKSKKINSNYIPKNEYIPKKDFFCGPPSIDYSHVVVSSLNGSDLFTLSSVSAMCDIQQILSSPSEYNSLCETRDSAKHSPCCPMWSLPNYIAEVSQKRSCKDITEEDIKKTKKLLETCASEYSPHNDPPDCESDSPCFANCTVYNIFHYITEKSFLKPKNNIPEIKNAVIFLPLAKNAEVLNYYKTIAEMPLEKHHVKVTAIDFGLKNVLFDDLLLRDTWLIAAGSVSIVICIWVYTSSLFLTGVIICIIILSLGVSYFFYTVVFHILFFPFMNILSIIVALGIGSDDAFIVYKTWYNCKQENMNRNPVEMFHDVLRHSSMSILVTCITTVAAFITSVDSRITAVACFSIFASTTVVVNFLLMVLLLPPAIILSEKMPRNNFIDIERLLSGYFEPLNRWFTLAVFRLKYLWIIILSVVTVISIVIVLYYPTLKLPDSTEFQLFTSDHYFEQYDFKYKNKFFFESPQMPSETHDSGSYKMPLRFIFGVIPQDNGDRLSPTSNGHLVLDPSFELTSSQAQLWLYNFCRRIRAQPFYKLTGGPLLSNCFMERFVDWMNVQCVDPVYKHNKYPCCNQFSLPFPKIVFNACLIQKTSSLHSTPLTFYTPGIAGPKFSKVTPNYGKKSPWEIPKVKAFVIEYDSNVSYTSSYVKIRDFFTEVETWFKEELKTAPPGFQSAFFISDFQLFDLQDALQKDTINSIIVSIIVALVVLTFSLLNIVLALLAIFTINSIIFVSIAILILLGWQLNVLESVAICLVIGISVDCTLHYVMNYKISPDKSSSSVRVKYAIKMMSGPSIMAGLTTAISGAFMLPSYVLGYVQIGTFLLIMISVSWIYANFFLLPLLLVLGPTEEFSQFNYPRWLCDVFTFDYLDDNLTQMSSERTSVTNERFSESREMQEIDTISRRCIPQKGPISKVSFIFQGRNPSPVSVETLDDF